MQNRLIVHDVEAAEGLLPQLSISQEDTVLYALPQVKPCIGCFGCWIKTPGTCVIQDAGKACLRNMRAHKRIIVVSRLVYGGLSPAIKTILDRSIGFVLPFFEMRNDEMHHVRRYKEHVFSLEYKLYGDHMEEAQVETAKKLIAANALNFCPQTYDIGFYETADAALEAIV